MMPDKRTELKIGVSVGGADSAAKDLTKVGDAQSQVEGKVESAAKGAAEAAEETKKLSASQADYIEVLRRVNPALGNLVDSLVKGSKIAGDMASAEINLGGVMKTVTDAIKGNAAALALIGAGGAVVLAIQAIASAVAKMRAELVEATKAVRDLDAAQTAMRKEEGTQQAAIEALRDKMRAGPFTAEQARAAAQTAGDIGGKPQFAFLDPASIAQAVAAVGGRGDQPGGGTRGLEDIAALAALIQTGRAEIQPGMRQEHIDAMVDRLLSRFAGELTAIFEREAQQAGQTVERAAMRIRQPEGSWEDVEALARRRTAGTAAQARGSVRPGLHG